MSSTIAPPINHELSITKPDSRNADASQSHDNPSPLSSFPLFGKLPHEVQIMIYTLELFRWANARLPNDMERHTSSGPPPQTLNHQEGTILVCCGAPQRQLFMSISTCPTESAGTSIKALLQACRLSRTVVLEWFARRLGKKDISGLWELTSFSKVSGIIRRALKQMNE